MTLNYIFQSMDFSMYSINNPIIKIIKNRNEIKIYILLNSWVKKTKGIKRVISISKIKKINLIKKNWILKGMRDLEIGSNPHSKGEVFSRFLKSLVDIKIFKIRRSRAIRKNRPVMIIIKNIIYIKIINLNFLIGS